MMRTGTNIKSELSGRIEVRGILGGAVNELGARIVSGEWPEGGVISREADLVEEMKVSRSVVREAVRILSAKGMLRSRTSDGTRVQPRAAWRLLDPDVMEWRIRAGDRKGLLQDLLRLRLVIEPGVAYAATLEATEAARARMSEAWAAKREVFADSDLPRDLRRRRFIETDLDFHRALIGAVRSQLLDQLFSVIEAALELLIDLQMRARGYTSDMIGMDESQAMHEAVFDAFIARDAEGAERAMRRLIQRAIDDAHDGFALLRED
ncbi:FadR/GntR family transcriptional regulator [Histidinibacterium lentulum]|uniref:FadR family transcriptional regulator n=1 Tax=Histidinibacterium lentulum TaxID=2480588 RepID=A0A3N2R7I5_9RHOB|nr:FCD domain-containing protein [Histidinibacterium lentulum]ROU03397.1 FadR family transcriptional regulator [Histidinibacterium lentulum]